MERTIGASSSLKQRGEDERHVRVDSRRVTLMGFLNQTVRTRSPSIKSTRTIRIIRLDKMRIKIAVRSSARVRRGIGHVFIENQLMSFFNAKIDEVRIRKTVVPQFCKSIRWRKRSDCAGDSRFAPLRFVFFGSAMPQDQTRYLICVSLVKMFAQRSGVNGVPSRCR